MSSLEDRLRTIVREAPSLNTVLKVARALALPDWMIFSGAVYQPVWNSLTGRSPEHGLSDYDLVYFDASDTGWDAEDRVIRRVAAAMPATLCGPVEARNQARVHLWFRDHFGEDYTPLKCSAEALERFTAPAFAVAVRLEVDGALSIFAPYGLEDLFAMRLRPTTNPPALGFAKTVAKARARWPEIVADA